jgi:hypothetical protein
MNQNDALDRGLRGGHQKDSQRGSESDCEDLHGCPRELDVGNAMRWRHPSIAASTTYVVKATISVASSLSSQIDTKGCEAFLMD